MQVDTPLNSFIVVSHNNNLALKPKEMLPNEALIQTCYLNGNNNKFLGNTYPGNNCAGSDIDNLIVVGSNSKIEHMSIKSTLVIEGDNSKFD